jgi:hypothetical protein
MPPTGLQDASQLKNFCNYSGRKTYTETPRISENTEYYFMRWQSTVKRKTKCFSVYSALFGAIRVQRR